MPDIFPDPTDVASVIANTPQIDYSDLLVRWLINLISAIVLIRGIYYSSRKRRNYVFNFLMFNSLVFLLCLLLSTATMQIGFAFGLFAIFSIMRFRTVTIPVPEMAYFFAVLALGAINALSIEGEYFIVLIGCNLFVLGLTFSLDKLIPFSNEVSRTVIYERMDMILPDKRRELLKDLQERTGWPIHRIDIKNINLLRDIARIDVYYYSNVDDDADSDDLNRDNIEA
jgi:hypothetical protein